MSQGNNGEGQMQNDESAFARRSAYSFTGSN